MLRVEDMSSDDHFTVARCKQPETARETSNHQAKTTTYAHNSSHRYELVAGASHARPFARSKVRSHFNMNGVPMFPSMIRVSFTRVMPSTGIPPAIRLVCILPK